MITNRDESFIKTCYEAAINNETETRAQLAACIVYKNRIISVGYNQKKSSPFQAEYAKNEESIYFHAETHAIKNFLRVSNPSLLKKSTMYIARAVTDPFRRKWEMANAMPCIGCARAIHDFEIGRVVYTSGSDEIAELEHVDFEKMILESDS